MLNNLNSSLNLSNFTEKKSSYCLNTMLRIETMKKAILQTEMLVNKTKESVELKLSETLKNNKLALELQKFDLKIKMLREELNREINDLKEIKKKNQLCQKNQLSQKTIEFKHEDFEKDKLLLCKLENELINKQNLLKKINTTLNYRKKELITESNQIFKIEKSKLNSERYTILGLNIPDTNDNLDENDFSIKTSLGYCCHLLILITKLLDITLRHPIDFCGSQSWILNETGNPKLKDKKYPLFFNRDKAKFAIAIQLLNENIMQIRHHFDLQTKDYKKISLNLFNLLAEKLFLHDKTSTE